MKIDDVLKFARHEEDEIDSSLSALFTRMIGTPQSKTWHREGNVFLHTMNVANVMKNLIDAYEFSGYMFSQMEKEILIVAAYLHDIGKIRTTYLGVTDNEFHCENHGKVGYEEFVSLFEEDKDDPRFETIAVLIKEHMTLHHILKNEQKEFREPAIQRLIDTKVPFLYFYMLNVADSFGSINDCNDVKRLMHIKQLAIDMGIMKDIL